MTEFTSDIKTLPYSQQKVYEALSDMTNLEKVKNRIPDDKIKDFSFDKDSCAFSVDPVGVVCFSIINREPFETIKFTTSQSPMEVTMWIQLKKSEADETKLKLTVRAELNPFLKPMLSKPLQNGINKIADILATIQYDQL